MKKVMLFLLLILMLAISLPAAAVDYKFISDLSQHKNKHLNIFTPDAQQYIDQGYTVQGEDDIDGYKVYHLSLHDSAGQKVETFEQEVTLYFRNPKGVDRDNFAYYDFTITQTNGQETRTYTTAEGKVFTHDQYGVGIKTDRLGDFQISFTVADNIGPTWDELMDELAMLDENESFEYDGIRVSRQGNKLIFEGMRSDSRISSDIELDTGLFEQLQGEEFIFDNVELLEVWARPTETEKWIIRFRDSVKFTRGMEIWMQPGSSVELFNDAEIRDRDKYLGQRDYPLVVDVPYGATFKLKGKGSIPEDYCNWHTSTKEKVFRERKSMLINMFVESDSVQEAAAKFSKLFKADIDLNPKQFPAEDIFGHVRVCMFKETDEETEVYEVCPAATHTDAFQAGQVNLKHGKGENEELTLRVATYEQGGDQAVSYEIVLVGNGKVADPGKDAKLYLPYPTGMDMETAAQYRFVINHYTILGEETFSTDAPKAEDRIELTPHGLCIPISSLSPFLMTWEEAPEVSEVASLPKTGDHSRMGLYLAMLVVSGCALCLLKRKTA